MSTTLPPVKIYPAIDLNKGRCVRLQQGEAALETVFFEDPGEPAGLWKDAGAEWVHVVDLQGAFEGTPRNKVAISRILDAGMQVQVGGGIRGVEIVKEYLKLGVSRVIIGTRACEDPDFIRDLVAEFGDQIVVGTDAKNGMVRTKGWVEESNLAVADMVEVMNEIRSLNHYTPTSVPTECSKDQTFWLRRKCLNFQALTLLPRVVCRHTKM